MRGLFITGTGTEVGKTHVTSMIAQTLFTQGTKVGVYKPVASGCQVCEDGRRYSEDAIQLWESAGKPGSLSQVCPQKFLAPLAPPEAAVREGRKVDRQLLREGIKPWQSSCEIVLVEGAGGLLSPISEMEDNTHLASDFNLPLLIVVANELGAINAARQTLLAAHTKLPQLDVVGMVLNQPTPRVEDVSLASNPREISRWCEVPVVATVKFGTNQFENKIDWLR